MFLPLQQLLFGVEPKTIELGLGLTDEVRASFDKLLETVVKELKRIGCTVEPAVTVSTRSTLWELQK
jgi:Ni,Fe-hydrogenase maturation factor